MIDCGRFCLPHPNTIWVTSPAYMSARTAKTAGSVAWSAESWGGDEYQPSAEQPMLSMRLKISSTVPETSQTETKLVLLQG